MELEAVLGTKVFLDLHVSVHERWREDERFLGEIEWPLECEKQAVEALMTKKTENVTGVMTAMEKSDLAFKTLLAIRSKLMDAYEEIKNISV